MINQLTVLQARALADLAATASAAALEDWRVEYLGRKERRNARPKRLRFAIFNHVGRVVHHARQMLMRVFRGVLERIIGPGLNRLRTVTWQAA